jgi:hypothetical protein
MTFLDTITILGYPLVAWLAFKGGRIDGIETTITVLHQRGLIELDEETQENQ